MRWCQVEVQVWPGSTKCIFKETYFKDQNSDTQIYLDKKCEGMQNLFLGTFTTNGLYNCIALLVILFNILQYTTYIEKQISRLFNKKKYHRQGFR